MPISFLKLSPEYTIGQAALGGIVAYILQPGDPRYDANTQHGLIAATSDQGSGVWWNGTYTSVSTSTALGSGLANTDAIIASQGAGTYAASVCRNYTGGGYTDWYLPSLNELSQLFNNRSLIGNFRSSYPGNYWSSSQYGANSSNAYCQNFLTPFTQNIQTKDYNAVATYFRAIRSY